MAGINEKNNIYGHLVVRKKHPQKSKAGENRWVCECSCGNYVVYTGSYLRSGRIKDCGCGAGVGGVPRVFCMSKNEKGKRYGKLVVLEKISSYRGKARWLCRCDCGEEVIVYGNFLRSGRKLHCGCGINRDLVKYWRSVAESLATQLESTTGTDAEHWLSEAQQELGILT